MSLNKVAIIKMIYQAVQDKTPETVILKKIRGMIQDTPSFNIREKAAIYRTVKKTADLMYIQNGNLYNGQIKQYATGLGKVEEHKDARQRRLKLAVQLRVNRAEKGVFYMSSMHSNPAKDHKMYQGVIFVDRFWKNTLEGDKETQKKIQAYIRNHDTMTVQEVCGAPVYFITRPYCKHFFIELDTDEVLGASVGKIQKSHPEVREKSHNIYYRKKYYMLRQKIHTVLNMKSEAEWDKELIKKQG